ncbi:hypothetical protein T484DRAFT_1951821 [Baffinella frigidus]|nr:hypothetical protein T484DRAFT_1951821 [Cryptophyta sp. CCMP2293]
MARAFVLPLLLINAASAVVPPPSARPAPCRGLAGAPALRHGWGAAFLSPPPSQLMRRPIGVLDRVEGIGQGATKGRPLVGGRSGGAVRWIGGRRGFGSDVVGRGDRVAQRMLTAQDFQDIATDMPYILEAIQAVFAEAMEHKEETAAAYVKFQLQRTLSFETVAIAPYFLYLLFRQHTQAQEEEKGTAGDDAKEENWFSKRLPGVETRISRDWGENAAMAVFMGSIWSTFGLYFLDIWAARRIVAQPRSTPAWPSLLALLLLGIPFSTLTEKICEAFEPSLPAPLEPLDAGGALEGGAHTT